MILLSLMFYYFFAFLLYSLGREEWLYVKRTNRTSGYSHQSWSYATVLLLLLFVLFSGLRYRTGVDCESYVDIFLHGDKYLRLRNEVFYVTLKTVLKNIGANRVVYLGVLAALQIVPFYYALKSRRFLYPYIGFLLIVGPYYLHWMNGIRQCIASCFFVWALVLVADEKKKLVPALLILIAAQFHNSAYVLLLFLFLPLDKDVFKNKYINLLILLLCAIVGHSQYMIGFINHYNYIFDNIGSNTDYYSDYLSNIDKFQEAATVMSFGPRRIIILLLSSELLLLAPKIKSFFNQDKFFFYSFNLFFINVTVGENLFANVSLVFRRPFLYTLPFELISFAYLFYYLKYLNKSREKQILYLGNIILASLYIAVACFSEGNTPNEATLFKFYIGQ